MNSFLFGAITLCLAAQCALAQYQSAPAYGNGYQQQRKMAPTPQTYGQQQQGYEMAPQQAHYEQPAAPSYKAASQYADSYNKPAAPPAAAYSRHQAPASSYAKAAPKYEEPYYPPMPFAWGYDINDGYGGAQYHKENGDEYGKRTGSYGYTDAYGVYRQVDYVADEHGFRATIKTNEPGTANESPADVELHAYEPPSNYYAGQQQSYSKPASYSGPAAAPVSTYSAPAPASYSAPAPVAAYHAAPVAYAAPAKRPTASSYQPASKAYPQQHRNSYESGSYSSGSSIVPVYQPKQQLRHQAAKHY